MIVYIENPIDSTKKLLYVINEFGKKNVIQSKYSEIKRNFVYQQGNIRNRNQEKNPIRYSNKKNKVSRNKPCLLYTSDAADELITV